MGHYSDSARSNVCAGNSFAVGNKPFREHCEKKKKRDLFVFFALMYFGKTEMSCIELSSEL